MNFRDLGGYRTGDGRAVRHGQLYRSGTMGGLTAGDIAKVRELSIRTVCDFRMIEERDRQPSLWLENSDIRYCVRNDGEVVGNVAKFYGMIGDAPHAAAEVMIDSYRKMPFALAASYREVFQLLLAGEAPLVFHCTVGKDRTGLGAALLLTALGVTRDEVMRDYQATDRLYDRLLALVQAQALDAANLEGGDDLWRPLLVSDPLYLDTAFATIAEQHGSLEAYFDAVLGVDAEGIARLRDLYTE